MISRGTLRPVKTSQWASPMVIVPKPDNSVRLCADYTATLAKSVDIEAYPLPLPDELLASLAGKTILDSESKPLLTINTIKGLMQYERLPYGISSAPAIVQRAMEELLCGLGVQIYLDDILVASTDMNSHLHLLEQVFDRLRKANIRLRWDKCEFAKTEVKYLGFCVSASGVSPDPHKVSAVKLFPVPSSVTELRSFLGLVRFYEKFIASLADLAKPLYTLLKKDVGWTWNDEHHKAFTDIKNFLISTNCLCHYDPSKPLVVATDASPVGVSAVLSHRDEKGNEYPIAYASRSLSVSESRYAQIDREALAIIYGVRKFSAYLLGRRFTLVTDHKPLQSIFGNKKGVPPIVTARLHRYCVFLMSFAFDVEYRPGPQNCNADALSRAPVDLPDNYEDETEAYLIANIANARLDSKTVAEKTALDSVLPRILHLVKHGWPDKCPDDAMIRLFWSRRNELSVHDRVLLWGCRVVMQSSVLHEMHANHSGIVKMKSIARIYVWWPSLSTDIENFVNSCDQCQMNASSLPSEAVQPWPASDVWQRVYLDYASNKWPSVAYPVRCWLEAKFMQSTTSNATLRTLYEWFSRYGFPVQVHTDGGPQFTSNEFT
ncbi:Uncharacterised protein r2_g2066 [Pycnogonum litorale]